MWRHVSREALGRAGKKGLVLRTVNYGSLSSFDYELNEFTYCCTCKRKTNMSIRSEEGGEVSEDGR
jgi:hypothetical protein